MVADSGFWIKCSSRCTMFQNGFIPSSLSTICLALVIGPKNAQKMDECIAKFRRSLKTSKITKAISYFHIWWVFSTSPIGFLQMAEEFFKDSTGIPTGITIRFSKKTYISMITY